MHVTDKVNMLAIHV